MQSTADLPTGGDEFGTGLLDIADSNLAVVFLADEEDVLSGALRRLSAELTRAEEPFAAFDSFAPADQIK